MSIDFEKGDGLVPAVVQDAATGRVLMLAYMNAEALAKTRETGWATFFSRSRKSLWVKGETSGNKIHVLEILEDCDHDTLLLKGVPSGPVCHTGAATCFGESNSGSITFLDSLSAIVRGRKSGDPDHSYTATLFQSGMLRIAQKVGEEAVESVIAAVSGDRDKMVEETADLLFHTLVMLEAGGVSLDDVVEVLRKRNAAPRHK